MLDHIGVDSEPPRLPPARGPPLWDGWDADVQTGEGAQVEPDWDLAGQTAPDYEAFPLLCPLCGGQMRIIAFITLKLHH